MVMLLMDGVSNDATVVNVPTSSATLATILQPDDTPATPFDAMTVSDDHVVAAYTVPPMLDPTLGSTLLPILLPTTVTLVAPVAAVFATTMPLTLGPLNVKIAAMLPCASLDVNDTARDVTVPVVVFTTSDVDDRHAVTDTPEPPTRTISDRSDTVM